MKYISSFLFSCSLIAGLSACGGGSDSKSNPSPSSNSSVSSMISSSSLPSSSLSSSALSSSSASPEATISAKVSGTVYLKDSDNNSLDLDSPESVKVNLSLLDGDGNVVATGSPQLIKSSGFSGDKGVPFAADISGKNPKTIVINVSTDGFSDYARRFEFSPAVNVTASLKKLQEITIAPSQVTSISGKALDGFNVSVNNSNGNEEIIDGDAGSIADLSVSIPQSALPVGTSSVDVTMQAFNPNDPEEAQSFPGAYQDSTGNKLLSVAFNYTDVKTDGGVSLQKIAQETRDARLVAQKKLGKALSPMQFAKEKSQKAGETLEPVIINRKIPEDSCASLSQLGDANSTQAGFQVPVYTYNTTNGLWDLLGYGTLFDEAGNLVAADQKIFNCAQNTYVLEIEATNEIFLSNWWNLDYPLIFTQPVKLCADLELRDEGNKPLAGNVLLVTDDDDLRSLSAESFVTDANGRVHIEVISLDAGADLSATAHTYNSAIYTGYAQFNVTLSTTCNMSVPPVVVKLEVPEMCKVEGRVINANSSPLAKHFIFAADFSETSNVIPGFALTDADGRYELSLQCKQKYQVIDWYSYIFSYPQSPTTDFEVNVNGAVDLSEVSDNSSSAVMKDLVVSTKPTAYVYPTDDSVTQVSLLVVYAGTDFPLTYSFSIRDKNSAVLGQYSGTITEEDFKIDGAEGFGYAEIKIDHHLTDEQIKDPTGYTAVGEIKDSKNVVGQINSIYQGQQ